MKRSLNFKPNLSILAVGLCSMSILAASCVKTSSNTQSPGGDGGGGSDKPGAPSTLKATAESSKKCDPSLTFCETEGVVNYDTLKITLKVDGPEPVAFTAPTLTSEQTAAGFKLTPDTKTCTSTLSATAAPCVLTLTYLPTSATATDTAQKLDLNYSYTNSAGKQAMKQTVTYQAVSLLNSASLNLPSGLNLADLKQLSFAGSTPTYWLTNEGTFSQSIPNNESILGIAKYELLSFLNAQQNAILLTSTKNEITRLDPDQGKRKILPRISNYAFDGSFIFGATIDAIVKDVGSIHKIDINNTNTLLDAKLPLEYNQVIYTLADKTQPIVYTLSYDKSFLEHLCSVSTSIDQKKLACQPTLAILSNNGTQNQIAEDGSIYIQSADSDGKNIHIVAYTTTQDESGVSAITPKEFTGIPTNAAGKVSMKYDHNKKIIYALFPFKVKSKFYFNLIAFDADSTHTETTYGKPLWTAKDASGNILNFVDNVSQPFVINKGEHVLVVASDSKVYGFNSGDGKPAFISGNSYNLPANSTPALNLVTLKTEAATGETRLYIPSTQTGTSQQPAQNNIYSMNISW